MLNNLLEQYLVHWYTCKQDWESDPGGYDPGRGGGNQPFDYDPEERLYEVDPSSGDVTWKAGFAPWEDLTTIGGQERYALTPWNQFDYASYAKKYGYGMITPEMPSWVRDKTALTFGTLNLAPGRQGEYGPGEDWQTMLPEQPKPPNPLNAPVKGFMKKLYTTAPDETLEMLLNRAKKGVETWTEGGPDAPRILTPVEWDALLPSEQDGLLGFLEFIGIPPADYEAMRERQAKAVQEAFQLPMAGVQAKTPEVPWFNFNFRPARQR